MCLMRGRRAPLVGTPARREDAETVREPWVAYSTRILVKPDDVYIAIFSLRRESSTQDEERDV